VVHNGIIENFREPREELATVKVSTIHTDTRNRRTSFGAAIWLLASPRDAAEQTIARLMGGLRAVFSFGEEDLMIAARKGSPPANRVRMVNVQWVGRDCTGADDWPKLAHLDEGDWPLSREHRWKFATARASANRDMRTIKISITASVDKGGHKHFMAEIAEQSRRRKHRQCILFRTARSCCPIQIDFVPD
jgi:glucosamine--fructose-6-phosphate aminotransferase (isomerizing)